MGSHLGARRCVEVPERGPCGEKVGKASDVPPEEARLADGRAVPGVRIRWLVSAKDGAPTYAMRLFELEPGAPIPEHAHPWEHEIYVLDGSMTVWVEEEAYELRRDMFIYIPPKVRHRYLAGPEGARFLCVIPLRPSVGENWLPPCRRG